MRGVEFVSADGTQGQTSLVQFPARALATVDQPPPAEDPPTAETPRGGHRAGQPRAAGGAPAAPTVPDGAVVFTVAVFRKDADVAERAHTKMKVHSSLAEKPALEAPFPPGGLRDDAQQTAKRETDTQRVIDAIVAAVRALVAEARGRSVVGVLDAPRPFGPPSPIEDVLRLATAVRAAGVPVARRVGPPPQPVSRRWRRRRSAGPRSGRITTSLDAISTRRLKSAATRLLPTFPPGGVMNARNRNGRIGIALALGGLAALAAPSVSAKGWCWKAKAEYVLPEVALADVLEDAVPALGPVDDHGINLGGIGSDLWYEGHDGCDEPGVYWMLTDRGPNGEAPRTFPVPEFTPLILKVRTRHGKIEVLKTIPITSIGGSATGVTGLPNFENPSAPPAPNELFYACDGVTPLDPNPNGLDPEGLVRTKDGYFWICEEYSPSLLKVDPKGRVVRRYFPNGLLGAFTTLPDYPTDDSSSSIPAIFGVKRKLNRGFEGITLSPNGKTLYLALQSPLRNPDNATGDASRNTRILAFDIRSETIVAEYVYRFQFTGSDVADDEFDVPSLGTTGRARPRDMKVSALAMVDKHQMLVVERTDYKAKVFCVDLREATNILGTKWDAVATAPSLETLNADGALEAQGIDPLPKVEILTMDSTQGYPQKIEGLAILDDWTLAIANDNDFGIGSFVDKLGDCTLVDSGIESRILVIPLDKPLKEKGKQDKDDRDEDE